jgi:N-sulfoglucosamine sulfohydrolase
MIKLKIKAGLTLLGLVCACAAAIAQPGRQPNFVLIIADDLAWDDLGAFGNRAVRTPHIDKLARAGLRFERAFVTASSCSPSRASLITGRYPHNTDAEQLHWPLPAEQKTVVEILKAAGYWTAQSGKWHLGNAVKDRFDLVNDVGEAGFQANPETGKMLAKDDSGAAGWIPTLRRRPKDKPFFLWFAALDPHRDYVSNIIPNPHHPEDVRVPPYLPDTPEVRKELALYYDEIVRLDGYVGQVVVELEQQGVGDNTMILFLSDNGRPFPRAKTTLYDSGVKTPLIVKWPGRVKAGGVTQSLISLVDIAPTILELAGLRPATSFQGRSFAAVLKDPRRSVRDEVYAEKNWHDFEDRARAVRTGRFKYIRNYYDDLPLTPPADAVRSLTFRVMQRLHEAGKLDAAQVRVFVKPRPAEELYDTQSDPHELHNLAGEAKYADVLTQLREKLKHWEVETGDHLPTARTPDEFDRDTGEPLPSRVRPRPGKTTSTSLK